MTEQKQKRSQKSSRKSLSDVQPKQLTTADLTQLNTALDTQKTIRILNDNYEVTIDTHFRESKINKVASKYLSLLQQLNQKDDISEQTIISAINLLPTLVIAEFSTVPVNPDELQTIEELINTQNALLDTGILKDVWASFDGSEIKKVTGKMDELSKSAGQIIGELAVKQSLKGVDDSGNNESEAVGSSNQ
jgi:hypothetical protein